MRGGAQEGGHSRRTILSPGELPRLPRVVEDPEDPIRRGSSLQLLASFSLLAAHPSILSYVWLYILTLPNTFDHNDVAAIQELSFESRERCEVSRDHIRGKFDHRKISSSALGHTSIRILTCRSHNITYSLNLSDPNVGNNEIDNISLVFPRHWPSM